MRLPWYISSVYNLWFFWFRVDVNRCKWLKEQRKTHLRWPKRRSSLRWCRGCWSNSPQVRGRSPGPRPPCPPARPAPAAPCCWAAAPGRSAPWPPCNRAARWWRAGCGPDAARSADGHVRRSKCCCRGWACAGCLEPCPRRRAPGPAPAWRNYRPPPGRQSATPRH